MLANRSMHRLALDGIPRTQPIDAAALDKILAGDDWWDDFYSRYPGTAGFVAVSLPVLSEDRQQALIYVAHSCDGLCGAGNLFVLQRTAGGWRIIADEMMWIS